MHLLTILAQTASLQPCTVKNVVIVTRVNANVERITNRDTVCCVPMLTTSNQFIKRVTTLKQHFPASIPDGGDNSWFRFNKILLQRTKIR